jgi:hypothetical protein
MSRKMTSTCLIGIILVSVLSGMHTLYAEGKDGSFGGGDGTKDNPYVIEDVWDLQNMSGNLSVHYVLGNDIDASATINWNSGGGFTPVGTQLMGFTGSLDGRNHTITGLYINRPSAYCVGLFGSLDGHGSVRDVGLVDIDVVGYGRVGGFVGYNMDGTISNCYAIGDVTGSSANTGGLVGINDGTLDNSHFSGNVEGSVGIGGLAGEVEASGIVNSSYFTGTVTGPVDAGGLVSSYDLRGRIINSHYNIDEVSINGEHRVTIGGLFDAQYRDWYSSGLSLDISDYRGVLVPFGEWFNISSVQGLRDLLGFAGIEGYKFRLATDLNISTAPGLFIPYLVAEFDGTNHTISGLYLVSPSTACAGMFGCSARSTIRNIRVADAVVIGSNNAGCLLGYSYYGVVHNAQAIGNVSGRTCAGVLVGHNYHGTVSHCRSAGYAFAESNYAGGLTGKDYYGVVNDSHSTASAASRALVGGLLGATGSGTVSNSSATGDVSGTEGIGGLIGCQFSGLTSNSFSAGDVTGVQNVGGLIGRGYEKVTNSYASGNVTGTDYVGGLIGEGSFFLSDCYARGAVAGSIAGGLVGTDQLSVSDCFWDMETSGQATSPEGTGKTTAEMKKRSTFTAAGWDLASVWHIVETVTYPFLRWQDMEPPRANAGIDQSVAAGALVEFDGSGSGDDFGIYNYTWTYKDLVPVTLHGVQPTYRFDNPGIFNVTLNVMDALGHRDSDTMTVTVNDITYPVADAGPDQMVDEGTVVTFDGSGSTDNVGILNYTWTFMNGSIITFFGVRSAYLFDTPGVFVVTLNVTDAAGNWAIDTMRVTVNDITLPMADAGPDQTVGEGTLVTFDGSGSSDNVGILNHNWTFTDGAPVALHGVRPTHRFDTPGVFVVTLNVTDAAGNWATDDMTVTVNDITPPVVDAGPDMMVDEGTLVIFDGSGSSDNVGIVNYSWTFADGTLITLRGTWPRYRFDTPGVFVVTLSVTDAGGNRVTDTVTVTVNDIQPPVADAGPDLTVDEDTLVTFDGSGSSDNVGVVNHTWTFDHGTDAVVLHGIRPSFTFTIPGDYYIRLKVTDAAGHWHEDVMALTVKDVTPPVADAGPDREVSVGTTVSFDGSNSTDNVGVANWTWSFTFNERQYMLYGREVSMDFTDPGSAAVTLTVRDAAGNEDETVFVIAVEEPSETRLPEDGGGLRWSTVIAIVAVVLVATIVAIVISLKRRET